MQTVSSAGTCVSEARRIASRTSNSKRKHGIERDSSIALFHAALLSKLRMPLCTPAGPAYVRSSRILSRRISHEAGHSAHRGDSGSLVLHAALHDKLGRAPEVPSLSEALNSVEGGATRINTTQRLNNNKHGAQRLKNPIFFMLECTVS